MIVPTYNYIHQWGKGGNGSQGKKVPPPLPLSMFFMDDGKKQGHTNKKSRQILHNGLLHPNCQHSSSSALALLPSEKLATINCAKNISKRRRRNTTNGLVILQTLMSPHWTVWEAIIHSFFSGQFQCARPPKYTKKTQKLLLFHRAVDNFFPIPM